MVSKKFLFISFLLAIFSFTVMAGTPPASSSNPSKGKTGGAVLHKVYTSSIKKRSPSRINIEIEYSDGLIVMNSDNETECLTLEICSTESGECTVITDIYPGEAYEIDLDCGQYDLKATNQDETTYQGIMVIEYY